MKKIFFLLMLVSIIFCNVGICFAETLVRVSDYTVNEFYRKYNDTANNITKNRIIANEYPFLGHEGLNYNNYLMLCGSYGKATSIILRANKEGHVSAISISTPMNSQESISVGTGVLKNIILVLGLPEVTGKIMLEDISNGKNPTFQYCYGTQRYIFMKAFLDKASGMYNTDLYAVVD